MSNNKAAPIGLGAVAVLAGILALTGVFSNNGAVLAEPSVQPAASSDDGWVAPFGPDRDAIVNTVEDAVQDAGFEDGTYTVDEVDPSQDKAESAAGAFSEEKIQTPAQAVAFLKSGTPQAETVLNKAIEVTGAEKYQLFSEVNWVCVQFTGTSVVWQGNTYYVDGTVQPGEARVDDPGTVACIFVPPFQLRDGNVTTLFVLRGACVNPQTEFPKPPCPPTAKHESGSHWEWNPVACVWDNPIQPPAYQDPQDNTTSTNNGANSGSTPGAGSAPKPNPVYTPPATTAPAPPSTPGGYDAGGGTGSAPGGTTTSGGTTTTTGGPSNDPVDTGQGGNNGIDSSGSSTGSGTIADPDA